MRAVFVGASRVAVMAARKLTEAGHEVVIIDKDREKLESLEDELDCGMVNDDGSRPSVLKEVGPESTQALFCMSDDDQDNIIASLVGRAMGFECVVTRIEDEDFESICRELGLDHPIIPSRETANSLIEIFEGNEHSDISAVLKGGLRFLTFVARDEDEGTVEALDLPAKTRALAVMDENRAEPADSSTRIREGDEVVLVTHQDQLEKLKERFDRSD